MKSLGIFSNEFIAELVELDIKTIERIKANDTRAICGICLSERQQKPVKS